MTKQSETLERRAKIVAIVALAATMIAAGGPGFTGPTDTVGMTED